MNMKIKDGDVLICINLKKELRNSYNWTKIAEYKIGDLAIASKVNNNVWSNGSFVDIYEKKYSFILPLSNFRKLTKEELNKIKNKK